ncbi:hypothetical protein [Alistipes sp. ZOR0009]|uniref:hypothetical protein n=1 Tax=Alistipes sp. ZOR0009 TaxID=1339253 RepID=UPI0006463186|nr:hypothetical protein [Alistipes sp. ZOR0009]
MKWKYRISIILNVILIVWIIVQYGINNLSTDSLGQYSNDFDFIIKLDNNAYTINTYKNTLTKQLDWHRDTVISYEVPSKLKKDVFDKLKKIDIFKYPEHYSPTSLVREFPSMSYFIQYTVNGNTRIVDWKENTESETTEAEHLRDLFDRLLKELESDNRIKNLPDSKVAYP